MKGHTKNGFDCEKFKHIHVGIYPSFKETSKFKAINLYKHQNFLKEIYKEIEQVKDRIKSIYHVNVQIEKELGIERRIEGSGFYEMKIFL
jgi:hypothetical protein